MRHNVLRFAGWLALGFCCSLVEAQTVRMVSVCSAGAQANAATACARPWQGEQLTAATGISGISDDGRIVSFSTQATNVIPQPVNGFFATYVRERWKLGDTNRDGVVNVNDLLAVINSWGPCPYPPQSCPADIAPPPNGDGVVNVNDLHNGDQHLGLTTRYQNSLAFSVIKYTGSFQ